MNLCEKVALANKVKLALIGSDRLLEEELHDVGHPELALDEEFRGVLFRRAISCDDCGTWTEPEDLDEGLCYDCASDYDWEDEE